MTDIVERLRTFDAWEKVIARFRLTKDAADEIEKLRAALREIRDLPQAMGGTASSAQRIARRALDE